MITGSNYMAFIISYFVLLQLGLPLSVSAVRTDSNYFCYNGKSTTLFNVTKCVFYIYETNITVNITSK